MYTLSMVLERPQGLGSIRNYSPNPGVHSGASQEYFGVNEKERTGVSFLYEQWTFMTIFDINSIPSQVLKRKVHAVILIRIVREGHLESCNTRWTLALQTMLFGHLLSGHGAFKRTRILEV